MIVKITKESNYHHLIDMIYFMIGRMKYYCDITKIKKLQIEFGKNWDFTGKCIN